MLSVPFFAPPTSTHSSECVPTFLLDRSKHQNTRQIPHIPQSASATCDVRWVHRKREIGGNTEQTTHKWQSPGRPLVPRNSVGLTVSSTSQIAQRDHRHHTHERGVRVLRSQRAVTRSVVGSAVAQSRARVRRDPSWWRAMQPSASSFRADVDGLCGLSLTRCEPQRASRRHRRCSMCVGV